MTAVDLAHVDDVEAIKALIQAFFDAINAADTHALQSHFYPSAGLTILRQDPPRDPPPSSPSSSTTEKKESLTVVIRTTIENFVQLIDDAQRRRPPGSGPVLHEAPALDATEVRLDGRFGTAWAPFTVTFDGVLHHYGTMVYTLGRGDDDDDKDEEAGGSGGWKIEVLTQSYRRTPGWEGDAL